MQIDIQKNALIAIDKLKQNGFEAYAVGGCVRDSIIGMTPYDWDICTNALPEETLRVFADFKVIETGLKHGTITVVINSTHLEITTFRIDSEYLDKRRPEKVSFVTDIKDDLSRRDFTMNAIAYNQNGLVDSFCGLQDIENKIIRCVGNPDKRFNEDALRIMRAIRFSSQLGFEIEDNTKKSIFKNKNLLCEISVERIFIELKKLLLGEKVYEVLHEYREIIAVIIPEIRPCFDLNQLTPHHCYDVYEHIIKSVSFVKKDEDLRLVMLMHDIEKPKCMVIDENGRGHFHGHQLPSADTARKILNRLKAPTAQKNLIVELIYEHDNRFLPCKKSVLRFLNKHNVDFLYKQIEVRRADTLAQNEYNREEKIKLINDTLEIANQVVAEQSCFSIKDLKINGDDLQQLGVAQGKIIGEILSELLFKVMNGEVENIDEILMKEAEKIISKKGECFEKQSKK